MDIRELILRHLKRKGSAKVSDVVALTGFSRIYIQRYFKNLEDEGRIMRTGKANLTRYILSVPGYPEVMRQSSLREHRILRNRNLSEDVVLREIKERSGIFLGLAANVTGILDYAFTEMLNNAIEHSGADVIDVVMARGAGEIRFQVSERGIGIFEKVMATRKLQTELQAIQELLKGKLTTAPEGHSGEGIFFTSKTADVMTIRSSRRKIIFDNVRGDTFVRDIGPVKGTKVSFSIGTGSKRELGRIFARYTDESYAFDRTTVKVKLYREGVEYISRSQARRIVSGLEKFRVIELDFEGVRTLGQGFADEVFRIRQSQHPDIRIVPANASETVLFMIRRGNPGLQHVNDFNLPHD
jgi:anti-sigma regulatory factor (Ser/Thr protein kinase)